MATTKTKAPSVIGRKKEDGYSEHKLMTRLASFLANRHCG